MPKRPPHLLREQSRHGAVVWYVRRGHGPRIRIRATFDTPEFWEEYNAALSGTAPVSKTPKANSLGWAVDRYRHSAQWAGYSAETRRQHEAIFRQILETAGHEPLSLITTKVIIAGRDRRRHVPHQANNYLKTLRAFFRWASGDGQLRKDDPTRGVSMLKGNNDDVGFHTWTEEEVARFEAYWPIGTRERLAFDILLYTGLRRGDAVVLGRQHVRDGIISIRTEKTGEPVTLPVLPPLAASIAATKEVGDLTFLVSAYGGPFVKESFGNWFRDISREAGCPGSAHGLRKAGATRAAENGATENQLKAMFGWTSSKQAAHYTRAASRKRLAIEGAQTLLKDHSENAKRPHLGSGAGIDRKK